MDRVYQEAIFRNIFGNLVVNDGLESNTNLVGPVLKAMLPRWNSNRFTLLLEVEGHPEYNSSYTFLLTQ